jgi:hypothetical protein
MDLYQAFSQPPGPGRLWISLGAGLLDGPRKSTHTQKTDTNPFQDPQTLFAELDAHNSAVPHRSATRLVPVSAATRAKAELNRAKPLVDFFTIRSAGLSPEML